ncbi:MAG: hypothetical protein ABII88_06160 [Candidatus Omnitrophota bacterium]
MKKIKNKLIIILVFAFMLSGCLGIEKEATTIFRNPDGSVKVIWQAYGVKSDQGKSKEELEKDYQALLKTLSKENYEAQKVPSYVKIWINDRGFLEGVAEYDYADFKSVYEDGEIVTVEGDIILLKLASEIDNKKNVQTNGKKMIKENDFSIQWSMDTPVLTWSITYPEEAMYDNKLAELFKKKNPKGMIEKRFDAE